MQTYPLFYKLDGVDGYLIWQTDFDQKNADLIYTANQRQLVTFRKLHLLREFAKSRGIGSVSEDEPRLHDLDFVLAWLADPSTTIDACEHALNAWNLLIDVAASLPEQCEELSRRLDKTSLYERLFFGNNLPAITPTGENYTPTWDTDDVADFRSVFEYGIALFRSVLVIENIA